MIDQNLIISNILAIILELVSKYYGEVMENLDKKILNLMKIMKPISIVISSLKTK